jgi:hypothetical protein
MTAWPHGERAHNIAALDELLAKPAVGASDFEDLRLFESSSDGSKRNGMAPAQGFMVKGPQELCPSCSTTAVAGQELEAKPPPSAPLD